LIKLTKENMGEAVAQDFILKVSSAELLFTYIFNANIRNHQICSRKRKKRKVCSDL